MKYEYEVEDVPESMSGRRLQHLESHLREHGLKGWRCVGLVRYEVIVQEFPLVEEAHYTVVYERPVPEKE
jgi:hypothetical protein